MKFFLVGLLLLTMACGSASSKPSATQNASGEGGMTTGQGDEGVDPPLLIASVPALGATQVYPAPLWLGSGEEAVIELTFSQPMTLAGELRLKASDHIRKVANFEWSDDHTHLRLFVRPDFSFPRPLAEETEYWLDLSALVNDSGAGLQTETNLDDTALHFSTGQFDPLLNHSCGHTFFGPFAHVVSTAKRDDASVPDISTTHVQYTVTLAAREEDEAEHAGWIRVNFPAVGPYRLYFDAEVALQLADSSGAVRDLVTSSTPPACPGVAREVTLDAVVGEDMYLFLGPDSASSRRVIVELVVQ